MALTKNVPSINDGHYNMLPGFLHLFYSLINLNVTNNK